MNKSLLCAFSISMTVLCQNVQPRSNVNSQAEMNNEESVNKEDELDVCDIKTTNRPDGNVIKYFNPKPVIQSGKYDLALSLYFNETTSTYFISTSVLFKNMEVKNISGDLLIQTSSSDGIQLKQVLNNRVTMNGEILSVAMFELNKKDIENLSKHNLKSVFVLLEDERYGKSVDLNKEILVKQFECLKKY